MTKPLSNDIRERVVSAVESGMSRRAAGDRFQMAHSTAINIVRRKKETGDVSPKPQGGDRRSGRMEQYAEELLGLVADKPDITLAELSDHFERVRGERFSQSVIWRCLDRHGMTFKKNRARQ